MANYPTYHSLMDEYGFYTRALGFMIKEGTKLGLTFIHCESLLKRQKVLEEQIIEARKTTLLTTREAEFYDEWDRHRQNLARLQAEEANEQRH